MVIAKKVLKEKPFNKTKQKDEDFKTITSLEFIIATIAILSIMVILFLFNIHPQIFVKIHLNHKNSNLIL